MKRFFVLVAVLAMALLAATSLVLAQAGVPSVANLVNFQGKLTTPAGNPVADGPHSFVFRIYDDPAAGVLQWSEGPLAIATTGGLFTHQLGSSTTLPVSLFEDFDSLYLEVEADGSIITPRTRLIASPYTKVSSGLDGRSGINPDSTYIKTFPGGHSLLTYGDDGQEQIRLWGNSWGEVYLYDSDPTNDLNVVLSANPSAGGSLDLFGTSLLRLNAQTTGDGTAILPTGAVNSIEMFNEPGLVSSPVTGPGFPLPGALGPAIIGVTLSAPGPGFAVILVEATFNATAPPNTSVLAGLTENGPTVTTWNWDAGDIDGLYDQHQTRIITRTLPGPVTTYTLQLAQVPAGGGILAGQAKITVIYFPTTYGAFASPSPQHPNVEEMLTSGSFNAEAERAASIAANQARMENEMAAIKAEMEALRQKIDVKKQDKQQAVEPNR
jgi:hypothetical protein